MLQENCVIKGQFYKGILGKLLFSFDALVKFYCEKFGSHNLTIKKYPKNIHFSENPKKY